MKRHVLLGALVFFIVGRTAYAQTTNAENALKFMEFLAQGQYEDALNLTAVGFKAKVKPTDLAQLWENFNQQLGPYESAKIADDVDKNAAPLMVETTFKNYIMPFTVNFDENHEIVGFFVQQQPKSREDARVSPSNFPEEAIKVKVHGGIISGTIMTPKTPQASMPIALIIAGSGPTDRNGNNVYGVHSNSYLLLAEALADNGIASFRYDKRLVGESTTFDTKQDSVVFQDFVDDAVILGNFLRSRKEFGKLFILGHSEGSNIGIMASQQLKPDAFVSLCGPGENLSTTLESQLVAQPQLAQQAKPIIQLLKQGKTTNNVPDALNGLFAPVIQKFIISSFQVEPTEEIAKLSVPLLIIGGTSDLQVPIKHAEALKQANPKATLLLISQMNHVLKTAPNNRSENLKTYTAPNLPLNGDLVMGLVNFLSDK
ncbi:hypothetical protein GCM10023231_06550 [Olivibacter ginsenosidimutans]|uniref:DUF3887 domain-containing protein n=1 Tax=Olivibacter ginsenosidimutans TaxID=1176537 RepID=A0ABP9AJ25_9SPHI